MSDSLLSEAPTDFDGYDTRDELSLLQLPAPLQQSSPIYVFLQPPSQMLPPTQSELFTKHLYSRVLLDISPPMVQVSCLQPDCKYSPTAQIYIQSTVSTGNLWKHYNLKHKAIVYALRNRTPTPSIQSSSASSFFEPRRPSINEIQLATNPAKYRELVLSFVVSNNLSLRIVESYSYRQLIQFLSPSALSLSSRTLYRELQRQFSYHRGILQLELHSHILNGGRISITTDVWSTRNYTEYAAVTAHWINEKW